LNRQERQGLKSKKKLRIWLFEYQSLMLLGDLGELGGLYDFAIHLGLIASTVASLSLDAIIRAFPGHPQSKRTPNLMPLHPQVVAYLEKASSLGLKPVDQCTPAEVREMMRAASITEGLPEPIDQVEDRQIDGPAGAIPIRIYRPAHLTSRGGLVYYHGGGWVGGDLDTHDALCRAIANTAGCLVIAVAYRLAPEHQYPAAAEDAYAGFKWVCENAQELHLDPRLIAVCGDSAGGNLAAATSLMARDRRHCLPCLQVLLYPATNHDFTTSSYQQYAEGYLLTTTGMKWFWQQYAPEESMAKEPYATPLNAEDLAGVPPALVILAEYDVLYDDGQQYAARLQAAGIAVEKKCYQGMIHGFVGRVGVFDTAREAIDKIADALQRSFRV